VDPASLRSLRTVISAGSPIDPAVSAEFHRRFGRAIHGFYGTSETGGIAYDRTGDATESGRGVGQPLDGVTVRLGSRGRFTVTSPAVLGRGVFRPADRGAWNEAGELVLLGRVGRMVKIAGRRVNLAEIERALRRLPGVHGALAHLVPGPSPVLGAAVATGLAAAELRGLLAPALASWKIPSRWLLLPELPTNVRGKIDARRLRQMLAAPRTATSISTFKASRQMSASR
jgi:acyl-coenzyme A synthetase/AMP-(fatty) acid ligase